MYLTPVIQHYFSYIVPVSFIGEETGLPGLNRRSTASEWQTSSSFHIECNSLSPDILFSVVCFVFHFITNLIGDINDPENIPYHLNDKYKYSLPQNDHEKYSLPPERCRKIFLTPRTTFHFNKYKNESTSERKYNLFESVRSHINKLQVRTMCCKIVISMTIVKIY